jgi:ESF2/ABP1 family protein
MTSRKRNEFLDHGLSDEEEDAGYNSEEQEESRGARSIKRRRVDQDSGDESQSDFDDEDEEALDKTSAITPKPAPATSKGRFELDDEDADDFIPEDDEDASDNEILHEDDTTTTREKTVKPLTQKQLLKSQKAAKKTGVIYISRIPPFMKPATLKHYLTPYGTIGRVFLTPEDPVAQKQRVRNGGNKKKSFTDGWVEFSSKKDAKAAAETLNGNIYHDDMWNMKYLTGFKWSHLTEQIANENAERAARLRAEVARTRRENKSFVEDVERSKMLEGMRVKKAAQADRAGAANKSAGAVAMKPSAGVRELKRDFKQNEVKSKRIRDSTRLEQTEDVQRVLSKIF